MVVPVQVKVPGLDGEWWTAELPARFGTTGAMSGTLGGGSVHVHCGVGHTHDCFAMVVGADPEMQVKVNAAASLPYSLRFGCHGSDGERLVVAGG